MKPVKEKIVDVKSLASLCYSCSACNTVCPTSLLGLFKPREFLQKLIIGEFNQFESILAKEELFNCLTCDLCSQHCPMSTEAEGIHFADIMHGARTYAFEKGLLNRELEEKSTHNSLMLMYPKLQSQATDWQNDVSFLTENPDLDIAESGSIALFVGCLDLMQNKFEEYQGDYLNAPESAIRLFNQAAISPVVLSTKCCGHDSYWVGDKETARELAEFNCQLYRDAEVKTVIVACAEGYRMWKFDYPELVTSFDFEVKHISEFILDQGLLAKIQPRGHEKVKVTYHDPCRLGRLGKIYEAPREILKRLPDVELVEMENNRQDANCCGISTFVGCNSKTRILREQRIQEAIETGAEYLITTCTKCFTHFNCYYNDYSGEGNQKERLQKIEIIDLISFVGMRLGHI